MRKSILITSCILLAGILSYFSGYFYYTSVNSHTKMVNPVSVQKSAQLVENDQISDKDHYFAIIEQDMLVIYKIPENEIYDSVKLSTLQLTKSEKAALVNGIDFKNIAEVFEFLESSMS